MTTLLRQKKPGRKPAGPAFIVPPEMTAKERRHVNALIKAQLEELHPSPARPFRFRYQLAPLGWLAGMLAGVVAHAAHAYLAAVAGAGLGLVVTVAATRGRSPVARRHCQYNAAWAAGWALVFTVAGLGPWSAVALAGWAIPYGFWLQHYAWRSAVPGEPPPRTAQDIWRELAEQKKWAATLGPGQQVPGGVRYPIACNGTRTDITQIMTGRNSVAAAYDSTITEAYPEPRDDGVLSFGWLTLLRTGTLDTPRPWGGGTIDPATGLAVIGRFPEGGDLHERYLIPGIGGGARHTIVGGCDGSGKTGLLDLGLAISAASGVIAPVILDPQEGQALPAWRDHVPYARGADECMAWLRGLRAAMMNRSAHLADVRWCKTHGVALTACETTCRPRTGMHFFDPWMTGLPIIEITIDEAPILLKLKGASALLLDIGKLGRKAGFRLRLAAQVPSIKELGDSGSELRSIMVGGNVICLRTGDRVSSGMLNIPARPNELPKQFRNGQPTFGVGYADTPDARNEVTIRTDWVEDAWEAAERSEIRQWDAPVRDAVLGSAHADATHAAELEAAADNDTAAQAKVLRALHGPVTMGELICGVDDLTVSQVVTAVGQLADVGKVAHHGGMIEPVPA